MAPRPPFPPFTEETARQKVQAAEDAWNTRDPDRVALAYTEDSVWRNRDEFVSGRAEIVEFLRRNSDAALGLTQPQLVSVAMILAGGAWLVFRRSPVAAPVTRAA